MRNLFIACALIFAACSSEDGGFSTEDEAAVLALEEAYRTGWLADDSAAVMATLAPGAVMMPAGMQPLVGDSAIRSYWWPNDGSETTIESYEIVANEVEGGDDFGIRAGPWLTGIHVPRCGR